MSISSTSEKICNSIKTDLSGNDRLFSYVQNALSLMPAELANFRFPALLKAPFVRMETGANHAFMGSHVDIVDPELKNLNPVVPDKDGPQI